MLKSLRKDGISSLNVDKNLHNLCRICLAELRESSSLSIFESSLKTMLTEVLSVELDMDDALPKRICSQCSRCVKDYFAFRKAFEKNDRFLREAVTKTDHNSDRNSAEYLRIRVPKRDCDDDVDEKSCDSFDVPLGQLTRKKKRDCVRNSDVIDDFSLRQSSPCYEYDTNEVHSESRVSHLNRIKTVTNGADVVDTADKEFEDMYDFKTLSCKRCRISYGRFARLKRHMIARHALPDECIRYKKLVQIKGHFKCLKKDTCSKVLTTLLQFGNHMKKVHHRRGFKQKFACNYCRSKFYFEEHIDMHIKGYHLRGIDMKTDETFACPECRDDGTRTHDEFNSLNNLARHCIKSHKYTTNDLCHKICEELILAKEGTWCEQCNKFVIFRDKHMVKVHHEPAPDESIEFPCKFCQETFDTRLAMHKHVKHEHRKSRVCYICGVFHRDTQHIHQHHAPDTRDDKIKVEQQQHEAVSKSNVRMAAQFKCDLCARVLKTKSVLKAHVKQVHEATKVACTICGKVLREYLLKKHMTLIHNRAPGFVCTICGKPFRRQAGLVAHQRTHTDERPFGCQYCDMTFRDRRVMRHHEMRHTGERPHACRICDRRFIQRAALASHMKTHLGRQPSERNEQMFKF